MIDTGCSITTINPIDSVINIRFYSRVASIPVTSRSTGVGGIKVDNVALNNCAVYYFDSFNSMHLELLNPIHVAKPQINSQNYQAVMGFPSLLGMDFLERYKIYFKGSQAILEK
jgi:hypothetical protein